MKEFGLFINGEWQAARSGKTAPTINPATEEAWATVAVADREDLHRAIAAAKHAHDCGVWRNKSARERGEVLQNVAKVIMQHAEELGIAEVKDCGAVIRRGVREAAGAASPFEYYGQFIRSDEYKAMICDEYSKAGPMPSKNLVVHEPIGVCAAITPWNFPLHMAAGKIAPALAAGNTIVVKPASITPVTTLMLGEICTKAGVPAGVVNIVNGPGATVGEELASHPDVGRVSVTGSTDVGRRIMQLASGTIKKVTLELGGKSANIILPDANLDTAALGALWGTFFHQGQVCVSGTRVLVHESIHDQIVERMLAGIKRIKIGDTMDMTTTMGPLVSAAQRETVEMYVALGHDQGARCLIGGKRPGYMPRGYYYEPTIFDDVDNKMRLAREEIFGPVAAIIRFKDDDEAVRIANDSPYGLAGGVWSADKDRALAIAKRMETGTVWINDYHLFNRRFPFGGYKQSGIGRELGKWGLEDYHEIKHIHIGEDMPPEGKPYFRLLLS